MNAFLDLLDQLAVVRHPGRWPLLLTLVAGFMVNATIWLFLWLADQSLPAQMSLHYTIYFGADSFGPSSRLYLMPLAGLLIIVINGVLAFFLKRRLPVTSPLLVGTATFAQVVLLLAMGAVIIFNR